MAENKDKSVSVSVPENKIAILVVEDDAINLKIMRAILEGDGYQVETAQDGQQCLDKVGRIHPSAILMDIQMPVLDGIQTCRQLKHDVTLRNIPVIFVTGSTDDETLQAAFEAGGIDFVRKPVNRFELIARVNTVLDQCRASQRLAEDEKLKGILETAGGVSHELNQPLQYVLGTLQLMMMDMRPEDPIYKQLDDIGARIEKMGEITRKLNEITSYRTRKYAGGREIMDINKSTAKKAKSNKDSPAD